MQIKNSLSSLISNSFSIVVEQLHTIITIILTVLLFTLSMMLFPLETAHAASDAVKWHPGHYYKLMPKTQNYPKYMAQVYSELDQTPALRGVQVIYTWAELEPEMGVYDFTSIDKLLSNLSSRGKRVIILVATRLSVNDYALIPSYLKTATYEWGEYAIGTHDQPNIAVGKNIRLWNDNLRYRLVQLFKALGNRYNSHPYFEGIGISETAMGEAVNITLTSTQINDYWGNLQIVHEKMRTHFPNTMTFQYVNFPRPIIKSLIDKLQTVGAGLGCPDLFLKDKDLYYPSNPKGVLTYYPVLSGIMPLSIQVEEQNYMSNSGDYQGYEPTILELLKHARDDLKVSYIFWKRIPDYYQKVLEVLNWNAQTSDPAGGLKTTCPLNYPSCIR